MKFNNRHYNYRTESVVKGLKLTSKSRFLDFYQFMIDHVKIAQCDSIYWLKLIFYSCSILIPMLFCPTY